MKTLSDMTLEQITGGLKGFGIIGASVGTGIGVATAFYLNRFLEESVPRIFFGNDLAAILIVSGTAIGGGFALGALGESIQQKVNQ